MRLTHFLLILVVIFGGYLLWWPTGLNPKSWTAPPVQPLTFAVTPTEILARDATGPAAIFVDAQGELIASIADGRFIRVDDGRVLAIRVPGRAQNCQALSHTRLLCIIGGSAMAVSEDGALPLDGLPSSLSDLAVSKDGALYFSQSHNGRDPWQALVEHSGDGRVLRYDDLQRAVTVVADGLHQPSGLALAADDSSLLVSEAAEYRVSRIWLKGDRTGTREPFIEHLPGFPAGIRWNGRDTYWLALYAPRIRLLDALAPYPALRNTLWRLPRTLHPQPAARSQVLGLDVNGRVTHSLEPADYSAVNTALEHKGALFLASPLESGVARVAPKASPK